MRRKLALLVLASTVSLAGCGGGGSQAPSTRGDAPAPVRHVPCDDGGSGGVMIHGVCL